MKKAFLLISFFTVAIYSQELSPSVVKKLEFKGQKIAKVFCKQDKLPKALSSVDELISKIESSKACGNISKAKLKAVAYYLLSKGEPKEAKEFKVPNGAKCPVCGMFVYKYPKWATHMVVDGKDYYFDGVKDMLKFYFFDEDFKYNRDKISKVEVRDFYTLESVEAPKAFYVVGSKILGPMGNELIPFKGIKEAKNFITDHGGELIEFKKITPQMVLDLDKRK